MFYKHLLTAMLLGMASFFWWMRTHAPATSTASSARSVLLFLVVGSVSAAIANHSQKA